MKFNFTSQICTTEEQSKRLLALGMRRETADMTLQTTLNVCYTMPFQEAVEYFENRHLPPHPTILPAWSLHRLKCLLSEKTPYGNGYLTVEIINENVYIVLVIENVEQRVLKYTKGNLYDNLISCINFFVKESIINKEYLEE